MRAYSPPVTRQRARALYIAETEKKEQERKQERRKKEDQQHKAKSSKDKGDQEGSAADSKGRSSSRSGRVSTRADAKELLATKRGRGTDFKPTKELRRAPRRGAAGDSVGVGGGVGSGRSRPLSSRTADLRPISTAKLGNSRSRCRKGPTFLARGGGGGGSGAGVSPTPGQGVVGVGGNDGAKMMVGGKGEERAGGGMGGGGGRGGGGIVGGKGGGGRGGGGASVAVAFASSVSPPAACSPPPPPFSSEALSAGAASVGLATTSPQPPRASAAVSASPAQPLEEVNGSVLNTKAKNPSGNALSGDTANGSSGAGTVAGVAAAGADGEGGAGAEGGEGKVGATLDGAVAGVDLRDTVGGDDGGGDRDGGSGAGAGGGGSHIGVVGGDMDFSGGSAIEVAAVSTAAAAAVAGAGLPAVVVNSDRTGDQSTDGSSRGALLPTPPSRGADGTGAAAAAAAAAGVGGSSGSGGGGGGRWGSVPSGEHLVDNDRLRGKSIEAKGSTGVSPMQKRNRRELKLSEEETAMAGAPQGPVYQVAVMETKEFEASPNPDEEMKAVLTASGGDGDWADLYSAVDSARRLCIFHRNVVARDGNLQGAADLVAAAVGNLRSSMVRNALLGVADMFGSLGDDMARVDIQALIAGTMQRLAGDKRFICQTAAQAMEAAARRGPSLDVLHAILPVFEDRNAEVLAKSAFYSEQCLAALGVGSKPDAGLPSGLKFDDLARGMARVFNGKVAEGRASAKRGFLRSRKAMGAGPFEAAVARAIGTTEAASILSTLAAAAAAADARKSGAGRGQVRPSSAQGGRGGVGGVRGVGGGGAGRPSIREQMMAARRKLEEEKRAAAAAGGEGAGEGVGGAAAMEGGGGFLVVS
eukprot:jgi/Undpi1/4566/HiC_scaffold_18.g07920.m1